LTAFLSLAFFSRFLGLSAPSPPSAVAAASPSLFLGLGFRGFFSFGGSILIMPFFMSSSYFAFLSDIISATVFSFCTG